MQHPRNTTSSEVELNHKLILFENSYSFFKPVLEHIYTYTSPKQQKVAWQFPNRLTVSLDLALKELLPNDKSVLTSPPGFWFQRIVSNKVENKSGKKQLALALSKGVRFRWKFSLYMENVSFASRAAQQTVPSWQRKLRVEGISYHLHPPVTLSKFWMEMQPRDAQALLFHLLNPVSLEAACLPLWAVVYSVTQHQILVEFRADDSETSGFNFLDNRHEIRR